MGGSTIRRIAALASVAAATWLGASGIARADKLVTIPIPDRHGEIPATWLGYPGPPKANVLLPDHYDARKRYPLLVLLHGLNCNYGWYVQTGLIAAFKGFKGIVVMPEGANGWYADWWNDGQRGSPAWESYELNEVLPAVLARYRILPQRRYHALAGISMGGLGAAYLGGRLPGFFGSVATLSGFVDPQYYAPVTSAGMAAVSDAPGHGDDDADPVYGPPDGFYADGHNPANLSMNLEQTRVFQNTGNGVPSNNWLSNPANGGPTSLTGPGTEGQIIYPMNQLYHQALSAAGVDVTYQTHPGGHGSVMDFLDELKAMLAWGVFKPVVTHPQSWVNDTVATSGQLWDVGYRFARPPSAVVQFRRSGSSLSIGAAGSAVTITTGGGCVIHTGTPATVRIARRGCREQRR